MELSQIPYQSRSSAADMLISKANRLTELTKIASNTDISPRQRKSVCQGINFYDIALLLMKPFDPGFSTVMNWKCLALIKLGKYSEAVKGYEEIIKISDQTEGKHFRNATARLAEEQIEKYRKMEDLPDAGEVLEEEDIFNDPPYCTFAYEFCMLLSEGKFKKAYGFLADETKQKYPVKELQSLWNSMLEGADSADINLLENMTDWPDRKGSEIGWCYFSVTTADINEAIAVVVRITEFNTFQITEIEFGRP